MLSSLYLQSIVLHAVLFSSQVVFAQNIISAGQVPAEAQTWGFGASSRCRLFAHKSIVVKNNDHSILVLDGGFGSIQTPINGVNTRVLDLNPFTAAFDLSKEFSTPGLDPLWWYRKPHNSSQRFTITNHGGLWSSADQNIISYQGGHYYNGDGWTDGLYHVNKSEIPPWQLWQMDVTKHAQGWTDVTNLTQGHESANRTFAGAAASVPGLNKSFWIGGLIDRTTSATTANDTLQQTTSQMLVYDETNNTITRQKYYHPDTTEGVYHGNLIHLPIGAKNGYLMSLMSLNRTVDTPWLDPDGESGNIELGQPVTLDFIPLYDLETGEWFEQQTAWFLGEVPQPRTRFCSALFHDKSDNSWSLWIHGGQLLSDQTQGVPEIYVLHMPSFIWSKVETTLPDTNLIRSHTCHAVGSQLVIVGGYPPGLVEASNVTCDPEYVKVLNIEEKSISWTGAFVPNSDYKTPATVANVVNQRTIPIAGFTNAKLQSDFQYRTKSSSSKAGPIAGGVVGGLAVILIVGGLSFWFRRRKDRRVRRTTTEEAAAQGPRSPPNGQPEALPEDNMVKQPTSEVSQVPSRYPPGPGTGPWAELEGRAHVRMLPPMRTTGPVPSSQHV